MGSLQGGSSRRARHCRKGGDPHGTCVCDHRQRRLKGHRGLVNAAAPSPAQVKVNHAGRPLQWKGNKATRGPEEGLKGGHAQYRPARAAQDALGRVFQLLHGGPPKKIGTTDDCDELQDDLMWDSYDGENSYDEENSNTDTPSKQTAPAGRILSPSQLQQTTRSTSTATSW
jgi:hypothetical protein